MDAPKTAGQLTVYSRRYVPLFRMLSESGIDLHLALLGDEAGARDEIASSVASAHQLPSIPPSPRGLVAIPEGARRLRHLVKALEPTIVEGSEPLPAIAMGLAARTRHRPVIVYRKHHGSRRFRLVMASRVAAHLADRTVVTNTPMAVQASEDDRIPLDRVLIARSGVPELREVRREEIDGAREDLGIPVGAKVVGTICRLRTEKGIDVLIEALDRMAPTDVHLLVVGSGPEEGYLRRAARDCNQPVHFVGHQDDVALWFKLSDIVAIPSRTESFGRTTIEAMCAGRPIVASRIGGLVEAIEEEVTGLLVSPEDPIELAAALERLSKDDGTSARLGEAARLRYEERYSMASMAREWRAAWEQASRARSLLGGAGS